MGQHTQNTSITVSGTSGQILASAANYRRTAFAIIALTAGVTVTIAKGDVAAVANNGIVLAANQSYVESTSQEFLCWQGAIQVVASGAGSVALSEMFED